jgi:hypothetical protein
MQVLARRVNKDGSYTVLLRVNSRGTTYAGRGVTMALAYLQALELSLA